MIRQALAPLFLAALLSTAAVAAQPPPTPAPVSVLSDSAVLSVSNSSTHVALPSAAASAIAVTICNTGAKDGYFALGGSSVNATTAHGLVRAGGGVAIYSGANAYVAGITGGSDTTTFTIYQGNGPLAQCPSGGGSGGGGAATIADGADIAEGTTTDLAWLSGAGTLVSLDKAIDRDILLLNGKLPALGQTTKTGSISVAIASDQTVPVSGTFFQATQPVSGAVGSFLDGALVTLGTEADAACSTDNGTCTAEALLKRANQRDTSIITALGSPLQAGGSIGNLFALDATLGTTNTDLGPLGATVCATDTGSCSINALFQRNNQRLTSLLTALGTPMQTTGGTVGLVAGSAVIGHVIIDSGSTTVVTGNVTVAQATASNLNAQVVGAIASGSANAGNPVKVGGVSVTAAQTLSTGNITDLFIGAKGGALVTPMFSTAAASFAGLPITTYDVGGNSRLPAVGAYVYDGTAEQVQIGATNGANTTGAGVTAVQLLAQFDDVSPTACTENNFCNLRMDSNRDLRTVQVDGSGNVIDYTQNINVAPGPGGRVDVSCSTGNVAAAVATCTMPATTGKTTYVTGFDISGSGATVGSVVTCTLTNTNSGTMSYTFAATAGALLADTPVSKDFKTPLKATASNTAPVLSCPSLGTGNTNMTINAYGYEL